MEEEIKYYKENESKEFNSQIVGWKNDEAQRLRFEKLTYGLEFS